MICDRDLIYIIIVLLIPFQFHFLHDYYIQALENIKAKSTNFTVPDSHLEAAEQVLFAAATVSSIISVFIYYKIKRIRLFISICLILNAIVWLFYLAFDENHFWVAIVLRIFNGMSIGVFHTISIAYLFYFIYNEYAGFYGYLIQTVMFLSLALVYVFFTVIEYKIIAIILAVEDLVVAGVIFIIPELKIPPKRVTHDYIFSKHNLPNLFIIIMLMVFQQFCGINIVNRKVPMLLKDIGLDMKTTLQFVFVDFIGCLANFIGSFIAVSISRRVMWCISSLGTLIGLILFILVLSMDHLVNWVGTLGAFFFYLFYGLGLGPITWYYGGELFPDSVRVEAGAVSLITNQVFTIIYTYLEKPILKKFDEIGAVILCTIFDFISIFFGMFCIPSHKNSDYENDIFL